MFPWLKKRTLPAQHYETLQTIDSPLRAGSPQLSALAAPKQKVIFDCDLGGDVDDAFAVALLLTSPEFEVLGLVMDHGNTAKRAQVAGRLLYELGLERQIPIIVGRPTPGIVSQQTGIAGDSHQFIWASGFERVKPASTNAATFIIENLRRYPGEVILFTVGPVCNIQDVVRQDSEALKLAQRVISMFGSFAMGYGGPGTKPDAEWNVRADVKAGQALLASGAKLELAGLDTTTMVKIGVTIQKDELIRRVMDRYLKQNLMRQPAP